MGGIEKAYDITHYWLNFTLFFVDGFSDHIDRLQV